MNTTITLAIIAYAGIAYWYFWLVLQHRQDWDEPGTTVLNVCLVLTIGPCLMVPALIYGWLSGQTPPALRRMDARE